MKRSAYMALWTLAFLLGTTLTAPAWGPAGHTIIAEIGYELLTPNARAAVDEILGEYTLSEPDISSWPDMIRRDKKYKELYPNNGSWHFIDLDVGMPYDENFRLEPYEDGNEIVTQITRWRDELATGELEGEPLLDALRFLTHFCGDIHQPLHCAVRWNDMGGNMLPVNSFTGKHYQFDENTEMEYRTSLHATWDEYLVQEFLAGREALDVAHSLKDEITVHEYYQWSHDDPMQWATECYWLSRKEVYYFTDGTHVPYKWRKPGMDLTSENYIDSHLPIVPMQLKRGGIRLALMLNIALDPEFERKHWLEDLVEPKTVSEEAAVVAQ